VLLAPLAVQVATSGSTSDRRQIPPANAEHRAFFLLRICRTQVRIDRGSGGQVPG
jgi:hypothetical protein